MLDRQSDVAEFYPRTGVCRCGRPNIHCDGHGERTMRRFRKKPVEIEAMQWDGTRASIEAICRWANAERNEDGEPNVDYVFTGADDVQDVLAHTLEGPLSVSPGDWIIRGVQGEFYPCKPDIFEQTYDQAA